MYGTTALSISLLVVRFKLTTTTTKLTVVVHVLLVRFNYSTVIGSSDPPRMFGAFAHQRPWRVYSRTTGGPFKLTLQGFSVPRAFAHRRGPYM